MSSQPHFVVGAAIWLLFGAFYVGRPAPIELSPQLLTLPANTSCVVFADIDRDGRADALVLDPVEKCILNYHQRPEGFVDSPDQTIPLPPQTAWVAACDVDPHPGLELLMSTASGLVYLRQNAGIFESQRHTLIQATQIFTNNGVPLLVSLSTDEWATNVSIPVVSQDRAALYCRNSSYEWSPGPPLNLETNETAWSISRQNWTAGPNPAHHLFVQRYFGPKPRVNSDQRSENKTVQRIIDDMKKATPAGPPQMDHVDLDGDGREDLVLWQVRGKLEFRTDVYIFMRGTDGQLPDRPTQTLHCGGFPIPVDYKWSPVHDLKGDGKYEMVLLEPNIVLGSPNGIVESALSHGMSCSVTIRSFHRGVFPIGVPPSIPITILLADWQELDSWPIAIQGDFNGDGRSDLLVRRSATQWNIFCSTTDGRWFSPQPAITFEAPEKGYYEIRDLNGDGLADIAWHDVGQHRTYIYLTPSPKGSKP